ncbi:gliding motility-associated C-terminal domain-containing protein [Sphingobacterium sp. SYP-B4668]|uniref:T9SS type B sorting domain-containing protein n=1 Tax=Sphingobacterium sp. SYP-B4668 TaxID=2996035 RepID=UPI0022DDD00D|nr:gliding motility-associated C-terminal domain-containing protein [Sphingobacterium sp. SYP-B4668]
MNIKIIIKAIFLFLLVAVGTRVSAQDGKGSLFSDNGQMILAEGTSDVIYSEKLFLGPNTDWQINGDLYVYSKSIWIAPTAKITGSGKLILKDPGANPYYEGWGNQPTIIDGNNGAFIGVNIVIDNASNIKLADITDPGYDLKENADGIAALKVASNIDFNVQGGDILLNGFELVLGPDATLLNAGSIAGPNQNIKGYVVTGNVPKSLLIKSLKAGEQFLFPVGISETSYTPAILTPQGETRLYVSVVDYEAAGAFVQLDDKEIGMDRVWHIFADKDMLSDYTLIHQSITNGKMFVDKNAEVMQYSGSGNWIGDVTKLGAAGVHTRADIESYAVRTKEGTWMTKFSFTGPIANDDTYELPYEDNYTDGKNRFDILVNDNAGSSAIDRSKVTIVTQPIHGTVVVNVDGTVTYTPDPGFVGQDVFEYSITDENGLSDTAKVTVNITGRKLHIPNVFTPNGDGFNDKFVIIGHENYDRINITIVNRWGNEVYRSTDYDNSWAGDGLNAGTYFYIIEAIKGSQTTLYKGDVLIKRN